MAPRFGGYNAAVAVFFLTVPGWIGRQGLYDRT